MKKNKVNPNHLQVMISPRTMMLINYLADGIKKPLRWTVDRALAQLCDEMDRKAWSKDTPGVQFALGNALDYLSRPIRSEDEQSIQELNTIIKDGGKHTPEELGIK